MQVRDCIIKDNLKELISNTYINKVHLFFDSLSLRTQQLNMFNLKYLSDEWPSGGKFPKKRLSEDKTSWKVSCWFVETVNNLESNQAVLELVVEVLKKTTYKGF